MRITLAAAIAGRGHTHQASIQAVLQVAAQDAVFNQHRTPGGRPLVIHIERATPAWNCPVIDHRAQLRGHLLPNATAKCRDPLAIKIAFQSVSNGFMEQDARPTGTKDNVHSTCRRLDSIEIQNRPARGLARILKILVMFEKHLVFHASATASTATLAVVPVLGNAQDVEAHQGLHITDHQPFRGGNEHQLVGTAERGLHLGNASVISATESIDLLQQLELARNRNIRAWSLHRIEIGGRCLDPTYGHAGCLRATAGNLPGRMGSDF